MSNKKPNIRRKLAFVLAGCGAVVLILLVGFAFACAAIGMISDPADEIAVQSTSPNGQVTATTFTRRGNATVSGGSTYVILRDRSSPLVFRDTVLIFDYEEDVVFGTDDETDESDAVPHLKWVSNTHLVVSNTGPLPGTFRKLSEWHGVKVSYSKP